VVITKIGRKTRKRETTTIIVTCKKKTAHITNLFYYQLLGVTSVAGIKNGR